ncbi:MAG TPA: cupin domain-containing protein [Thermoanaerobaculia bacterium]|jgi:quercetin dioxygenase-like cupin family protein|nr:cupin domain-containing protein [Thermoanaerobaculia bacterium]
MTAGSDGSAELAGVASQSDVVQYQTGAVVSRTLLKSPGGTVTAFAFDAGEGLSEHTAPFDALVLMIEGEAEISISASPHRLHAGQLLKLPARQPHAVKAITRFKMFLVMIKA